MRSKTHNLSRFSMAVVVVLLLAIGGSAFAFFGFGGGSTPDLLNGLFNGKALERTPPPVP